MSTRFPSGSGRVAAVFTAHGIDVFGTGSWAKPLKNSRKGGSKPSKRRLITKVQRRANVKRLQRVRA